jgi:hypothetical protein
MTTLFNNWFKQLFIHHASDRCIIVDKPSTMSDADAMHCDDGRQEKSSKVFVKNITEKNTIVVDKFQACFIDCTCQCEVRLSEDVFHEREREIYSRQEKSFLK